MTASIYLLDQTSHVANGFPRSLLHNVTRHQTCHYVPPSPPPPCPPQGLMHMAKTEGMRGMMKGNWTNCVRIIPNSAMKFFTYEQLSR